MTSAALYARISDDKEGAGLGTARQLADCRELAEKRGWTVAREYEDNDYSAFSGRKRPGYRHMLADVASGTVNAVVAWHTDRLHRSPLNSRSSSPSSSSTTYRSRSSMAGCWTCQPQVAVWSPANSGP